MMPVKIIFAAVILITGCSDTVLLPEKGEWEADSEVVNRHEEQRPGFIWQEDQVPPYELPDLMLSADGSVVRSTEEWVQRREEIIELFRNYMYGRRPGVPDELTFQIVEEDLSAMDGEATLRQIVVYNPHQDRSHQFEVILFLPNEVSFWD